MDARRSNRMRICLDTTYLEAVLLHRFVSLLGSIAPWGGAASGRGGNTLSCRGSATISGSTALARRISQSCKNSFFVRTGFAVLEGFELNRLRHESIYSLSSPKLMRLMLSQKELSTIRVYSLGNQILGARLIGAFSGAVSELLRTLGGNSIGR